MRLESSIGDGFLVKMQGYQDGPGEGLFQKELGSLVVWGIVQAVESLPSHVLIFN